MLGTAVCCDWTLRAGNQNREVVDGTPKANICLIVQETDFNLDRATERSNLQLSMSYSVPVIQLCILFLSDYILKVSRFSTEGVVQYYLILHDKDNILVVI